jgi:predicted regulator of Ras-like GTPase activity (Roadblock/LC7/MglB family)
MDDEPLTAADLKKVLDRFVAMPGVGFAALVDRDGFLIEATGERVLQAELAAALASCLAESSSGIGRELGHGALHGLIFEFETGIVSLHAVGAAAMLVVGIVDPPILGKVRYYVKKALPDLLRVL